MSRRRHSNLHRSTPEPGHGDWRVHVPNAEEVEHNRPSLSGFRNMIHRTYVVADMLQNAKPRYTWEYETDDAPGVIPIRGWARFRRLLVSFLFLLPLCITMVFALGRQLWHASGTVGNIEFWLSVPVWYTVMGAMVFVACIMAGLMQTFFIYVYVLGHELTHAIAAKLSGGKVGTFRITTDGGYVESDKDSTFIALAPYFVPLWMLCWMLVLWLANCVFPFENYLAWFSAGFGFWWFFHLYWTIWVIPREQPDMIEKGLLFSLLTVFAANILILLSVLICFGVVTPAGYWADFLYAAGEFRDALLALATYALG